MGVHRRDLLHVGFPLEDGATFEGVASPFDVASYRRAVTFPTASCVFCETNKRLETKINGRESDGRQQDCSRIS